MAEESKEEKSYMVGDINDMFIDVCDRLKPVELNQLEAGLLKAYLQKPDFKDKVHEMLLKVRARHEEDPYYQKRVDKVLPLFREHDFWSHQPVPKYFDAVTENQFNAPLEIKDVSEVQPEPLKLPEGYEWQVLDLNDDATAQQLYELLTKHYVEDSEGKFRFDYSIDFLRWALAPPDNFEDWNIAVSSKGKLYGFISAIPVTMVVNGELIKMAEVNFLCVHKQIRDRRLAPILIKEITRRVNLRNMW